MGREKRSFSIEIQVSARWGGEASGLGVACPLQRRHLQSASITPRSQSKDHVYSAHNLEWCAQLRHQVIPDGKTQRMSRSRSLACLPPLNTHEEEYEYCCWSITLVTDFDSRSSHGHPAP